MRTAATIFVLLALAALAAGVVLYATPHGIGISPDSIQYIASAQSLAAGKGFVFSGTPLTHFPPLYPLLLAAGWFRRIDAAAMARWVSATLLACDVILAGLLTYACTGRAALWSWLTGICVLMATPLLYVHTYAWSEPLFIFLSLLSLAALARHLQRGGVGWLLSSAVLAAGAFLTRYAGAALLISAALCIVSMGRGGLTRRLADVILFLSIAALPMACWLARNHHVAGMFSDRQIAIRWTGEAKLKEGAAVVSQWIIPPAIAKERQTTVLLPMALLLFLAASCNGWRCPTPPGRIRKLPVVLVTFVLIYVAFLCVSISLIDPTAELNERILAPIFLPMAVVALCISHTPVCRALSALGVDKQKASRLADAPARPSQTLAILRLVILGALLLLAFVSQAVWSYQWIDKSRRGPGPGSPQFGESPMLRHVDHLAAACAFNTIIEEKDRVILAAK